MSDTSALGYHRKPWTCQYEITYGDRVVAKVVCEDESLVNLMASADTMLHSMTHIVNSLVKALHAGRGLTMEETAALKTQCVQAICGAQGIDLPSSEPEDTPTQTTAKPDEYWIVNGTNQIN